MPNNRLKAQMVLRGVSAMEMAQVLRISRSSFYRKRSGKGRFTQREIRRMIEYLAIEDPIAVFFGEDAPAEKE